MQFVPSASGRWICSSCPRAIALVIALPLLTVYADVLGVFGGMLIASNQLNVSFTEFVARFEEAVALRHFLIGIGKAPFFAMIIALVGCYQGFQIRGGVEDVGRHTTISVVQSIFLVIIFDAICCNSPELVGLIAGHEYEELRFRPDISGVPLTSTSASACVRGNTRCRW